MKKAFLTLIILCLLLDSGCFNQKTDNFVNDNGGDELTTPVFSISDFYYIELGKTSINDVHIRNGFYSNITVAFGRGKGELYPTLESSNYICLLYDCDEIIIDIFIHKTNNQQIAESIEMIHCQ